MNNKKLRKLLHQQASCSEAMHWVGKKKTLRQAWVQCPNPEWMFSFLDEIRLPVKGELLDWGDLICRLPEDTPKKIKTALNAFICQQIRKLVPYSKVAEAAEEDYKGYEKSERS